MNVNMNVNMNYVDNLHETATISILKQLKVFLFNDSCSVRRIGKIINNDLMLEHKYSINKHYAITSGQVTFEFRDFADCYIRLVLNQGQSIDFPPEIYRRMYSSSSKPAEIYEDTVGSIIPRYNELQDGVRVPAYHTQRELVCELCRQFFVAGWVTGTGGSISIRHGNRIYMTPSGVQKERILPDELYVLDIDGNILNTPLQKYGCKLPKLSDCSPLFLHAFKQRNAGAVLHSHAICTNLVTSLFEGQSEFVISHQEMIKGITGHGYFDQLSIPIIENTAHEHELSASLGEAIAKNPKTCAILVRRHGMYVWGDSWEQAKRHGECLHYLFEIALNMKKLGMDFNSPPVQTLPISLINSKKRNNEFTENDNKKVNSNIANKYKHVIFDIEGTTTPVTFVKDVLFPYSSIHVKSYLQNTWEHCETREIVIDLLLQRSKDSNNNNFIHPHINDINSLNKNNVDEYIECLVNYIQWNIMNDNKISPLKKLQGKIWQEGYCNGDLKSIIFDDVLPYFYYLKENGVFISIFSSGSKEAQQLLFKHTNQGDIRSLISCYFDTKIGNKREINSYKEICLTLGVDNASEILFLTDIIEEAQAATDAGIDCILSIRDGNAELPHIHNFKTVTNFNELY